MKLYNSIKLSEIIKIQIKAAGMMSENDRCRKAGKDFTYTQDDFWQLTMQVSELAKLPDMVSYIDQKPKPKVKVVLDKETDNFNSFCLPVYSFLTAREYSPESGDNCTKIQRHASEFYKEYYDFCITEMFAPMSNVRFYDGLYNAGLSKLRKAAGVVYVYYTR